MRSQMGNMKRMEQQKQMEFLRDFDLLTKITAEEEVLYGPADLHRGNEMMKSNYVHKEDGTPYSMKSHIDEFQRFGPGIYLLFKLLKYLSVVFGVVSLFAMSSIIVLLIGEKPNNSSISSEFRSGILNTTIYRLSQPNFSPYVGLHFTIGVLIGVFLVYWREKEKFYVIECLKTATLASYSTVVIKDKTGRFTENDLAMYLNKHFGEIAEIYTVRNFGQDILRYKEINQLVQDYKEEKALTELQKDRDCNKLMNLFFKFRQEHFDLKRIIKESQNYKACFTFVRFKKIQDRQKLIEFESKRNLICCFKSERTSNGTTDINSQPQKMDTSNISIKQCEMQPCGIIWQNLHLPKSSKIIKIGVVVFLLLLVLTISCFLIFLLSVMQMSVSNSKFKYYQINQLIKLQDQFALLSYCVNLSFSQFYNQYNLCSTFKSQYIKLTIMMLLIPVSISLFKFVLSQIKTALLHFRRYAYQISRIESLATIIFIFYFLVTGPFQLFVYLGSDSSSFFNIFTPILKSIVNQDFDSSKITLFLDYSPDWYVLSSSNIFMIGAMSFNLSAIGIIFYCFIRSKIFQRFAIKQKIQIKMNFWLQGYHLQIQYVYGAILTIVYFTLLFGGSMPLLYPLAFVSFLILFWSYKYVFIRFCIKPLIFNHSVNRRVSKMMFGALLIHCIFTPIFYHAPNIANFQKQESFIQRIFSLWYYFILFLVICGYLLLQKSIRILIPMIKKYFQKMKTNGNKNQQGPSLNENISKSEQKPVRRQFALPTIVRRRHNWLNSESYSMHQNPIYKQILKTLYTINNKERARKSFILNAGLFHLYEDTIKTNQFDSKALNDVIQLVRRDFKKYSLKHKKSANNPYLKSKKRLYEIYQNSKKGEARKYTLNFSGSSGFREMESGDGFLQNGSDNYSQGMTKEDAIFESLASESYKKRKSTINEKVIEQPSSMSSGGKYSLKIKKMSGFSRADEINTENSNSRRSSEKASIQHNLPSNGTVEIPQESQDRINQSKF